MNLKARKIKGSNYSDTDILEVLLDYNQSIEYTLISHSIEMISGPRVTHGGGAEAEEYLHYIELPEDENAVLDYSSINMEVVQMDKGESVIKVLVAYRLKSEIDAYNEEYQAWIDEEESDAKDPVGPIIPSAHVVKTGNITLAFEEDVFV